MRRTNNKTVLNLLDRLHTLGIIECELPQTDLYTFNGKIEVPSNLFRDSLGPERHDTTIQNILPLMAENLMLRGSRVKNTDWVIACAVYTGEFIIILEFEYFHKLIFCFRSKYKISFK